MARDPAWRKAMLEAIRRSARETSLFKGTTLANGLRCIRTFERINGVPFDPFNSYHCQIVDGMAVHEGLFRKLRLMKPLATTAFTMQKEVERTIP